ncbi:DUF6228 family protein [Streptomyces erythrochromogenes]|uniref:DUF6228 family protein n=1 Tax=Streptomyces erythrochromogenes TaxID=285574 RepID=UPI00382205BC
MISQNDGSDEPPHVAVRCQDNASVRVGFHDRHSSDGHCVHYGVEVRAPGMRARLDDAVAWIGDGRGLARFLEQLAADFRGWDGERHWRSDDRDLGVSAAFGPGGYVDLTWTLRPWRHDAGGWSASVTTRLEAGEQMASLAADVRHFLDEGAAR